MAPEERAPAPSAVCGGVAWAQAVFPASQRRLQLGLPVSAGFPDLKNARLREGEPQGRFSGALLPVEVKGERQCGSTLQKKFIFAKSLNCNASIHHQK